tara:strand:+ start:2745 stop:3809 length:1065 start_codon:yes stop_codon:yes gene_type:complete
MSTHRLHEETQREDEASLWLAKIERGLSPSEVAALNHWFAADSGNKPTLLRFASLWDKMDVISRLSEIVPRQRPRQSFVTPWVAIAAALVVAIALGMWVRGTFWLTPAASENHIASTQSGVFETAVGSQSTVQLSDGTRLWLNTDSRVQVQYSAVQRLIYLEHGEILIEVAHNKSRPLSVLVLDRVVQAVGTAFSVQIKEDSEIELMVKEGRVIVGIRPPSTLKDTRSSKHPIIVPDPMTVNKDERVSLRATTEQVEAIDDEDIEVKLSWRSGNLIFRGDSLATVAKEISRYTQVEFVFKNDDLKVVRVAGMFKASDVAGFLEALKANFNIVSEKLDNDRILLKSAPLAEVDSN